VTSAIHITLGHVEDTGKLGAAQTTLDVVEPTGVLHAAEVPTVDIGQAHQLQTAAPSLEIVHQTGGGYTLEIAADLGIEQRRLQATQVALDDGHAGVQIDPADRAYPTVNERESEIGLDIGILIGAHGIVEREVDRMVIRLGQCRGHRGRQDAQAENTQADRGQGNGDGVGLRVTSAIHFHRIHQCSGQGIVFHSRRRNDRRPSREG